jgi:hypothetical protein
VKRTIAIKVEAAVEENNPVVGLNRPQMATQLTAYTILMQEINYVECGVLKGNCRLSPVSTPT